MAKTKKKSVPRVRVINPHALALGKWFKEQREKAEVDQGTVSKAAKLRSQQMISNIERGINFPTPKIVSAFSKVTKVDTKLVLRKVDAARSAVFSDMVKQARK